MSSEPLATLCFRSMFTKQDGLLAFNEIQTKAAAQNPPHDLTGMLIFDGHHFLQLLEGPMDAVTLKFQSIARDTRHGSVLPFAVRRISERGFPDWTSEWVTPETFAAAGLPPLGQLNLLSPPVHTAIRRLLKNIRAKRPYSAGTSITDENSLSARAINSAN
ncbi:BLUF domain-containing protein [Cochlodiniinecator piscidefendens]|uniref:BLUF domain-containing protein n=1 Tax=Cochlodiniinecator piscidefendens TaxID=2715756 RepID=UPI001407CFD0|nr:BLUF domain-containing protein [Cochlodiniinecator piscidefendens]